MPKDKTKKTHKYELTRYIIEEKVGKHKWEVIAERDVLSSIVDRYLELDDGIKEMRVVKEKVKVTYKLDGLNKKVISEEVESRRIMDC